MSSTGVVAGWLFSHYIVFPYMIEFFGTFSNANLQFMPKVETACDLYMKMLLGMAIVFQMPTVVFFLAKMGLVSARLLWSNIKYAILIIFILAAVLTPSGDPGIRRVRRADGRPLRAEHRHRLGGGAPAAIPADSVGLQQPAQLPLSRVVGRAPGFAGRVDPDRFLLLALHLDDRGLPPRLVRLGQDPEAVVPVSSSCLAITELYVIDHCLSKPGTPHADASQLHLSTVFSAKPQSFP